MRTEKMTMVLGKLLSLLRVRTAAAGMEVSDEAIRLVYSSKKEMRAAAVVLGPGIMERGMVKDVAALASALAALRAKVPGLRKEGRRMNVAVSLGSASVYTQSFVLPPVEGDELKKAIDLNLQMSSPDDLAKSYYGARVLARDPAAEKVEVSASFIDKGLVDGIVEALFSAGFVTTCVESRAMSLARIVRERFPAADPGRSYLLLDIDATGIDVLVLRNGELYFEYATPWSEVADAKGQVSMDKFNETIAVSLRQVSNFYRQKWQDPLAGIIMAAAAFGDDVSKAAGEALGLPVIPLVPDGTASDTASPEWFTAMGALLRGTAAVARKEGEIDLAGDVAAERYGDERLLVFLEWWRVIVPAALVICVATLAVASNFLGSMAEQLQENAPRGAVPAQAAQIAALQASSTAFNAQVQLVLAAQSHADKNHLLFDALDAMAASSSVSISSITFQNAATPVSVSGVAATENDIVEFKDLVAADAAFSDVNLPLSSIQPAGSKYSFSMTFSMNADAL